MCPTIMGLFLCICVIGPTLENRNTHSYSTQVPKVGSKAPKQKTGKCCTDAVLGSGGRGVKGNAWNLEAGFITRHN